MAQGIMTPFCLIINSRGRLVPHVPADAARQPGCASWRAKHEVGMEEKLISPSSAHRCRALTCQCLGLPTCSALS